MDLGAYFLKLREERGKTYKKVFEDLRLREEQIQHLEANRFYQIGPYGIAKAMVFNYARYLDADVDAVMAAFREQVPERGPGVGKSAKPPREKKIMLSTNFLWMVGIFIFVVILGSILWYAYNQGWLKAPDIFKASAADTTVVEEVLPKEDLKPDSLRQKMRDISQSVNAASSARAQKTGNREEAIHDSTDYLGNILGPSQVNVPIH